MKRSELNVVIIISIFFSIIIGIGYLWLNNDGVNIKTGFKAISFGITCITLFWTFYINYGWKWPVLKKLFYRPNISGTWSGEIVSDWKNEAGETVKPKSIFVVIRQSFLRINCTTYTDTFIGKSYSETFSLNKIRGIKNVVYLYRKETSYKGDNINNEGATELRLIESEVNRLEGKYWSNTKTNGTIKLIFIAKNHVDSYEKNQSLVSKKRFY